MPVKITALPASGTLDADDLIPVVQDGTTVKAPIADVLDLTPTVTAAQVTYSSGLTAGTDVDGALDDILSNLVLVPGSADSDWVGPILLATAGESLVIGDVVYIKSDSKMGKADADAAATSGVAAIALGTIANNVLGGFGLPGGFLRKDSLYAFTPGATLYLSTTPGAITATAPSGAADIVHALGYAYNADTIFFNPTGVLIEVGV